MEAGEGQPPPICFNTTTTPNYNYPPESPILPPTHHQHHHQPQMELEALPLDIDWVSLLNATVDPTSSALAPPSAVVEGKKGGGQSGNLLNVSCKPSTSGGGGGGGRGNKKGGAPARVAFHTRSVEDVLDDGFKWRKYGQKSVKNSLHPRSYYRCTYHTCNVKKQIQRLSKDTSIVVTTYQGVHNHPTEKLMETLAPLLKQLHFLGRF